MIRRVGLCCALLFSGCDAEPRRDIELAVPVEEYPLGQVRVVALETGVDVSLEEASFDLRSHLRKDRVEPGAPIRAVSGAAFYPAPAGYAWFSIDPVARVKVTRRISSEPLALARVDDGLDLSLSDFVIHGEEEDGDGRRAIRLEVAPGRAGAFRTLLERAMRDQILFVVPGRVLLAVDIAAPISGEFWLLDLPDRGVSTFVDRMARAAKQPR